MRSYLSLVTLLIEILCCSGFRGKHQFSSNKIFEALEISKAVRLNHDTIKDQRRTSTVATGDVEVTCTFCSDLGIPLSMDKIPFPSLFPDMNCTVLAYDMSSPEMKQTCIENVELFTLLCCDTSEMNVPLYKCTENIQEKLFTNMNKDVAPFLIDKPLLIDVHLSFQALEKIDVKLGTASMFVFLNLKWFDPRLAWNRTHEHCASSMSVKASINRELTKIWVPDFDLYNRIEGVQSWSEVEAVVRFDGMVQWERSGVLDVACTFKGLKQMPFDTVGCQLYFGGFTQLHRIQYNANPGFDQKEFTRSFQEFTINSNMTEVFYPEPTLLEGMMGLERSGVVYNFYFERSSNFYVTKMIIPSILFTFVSFGLFLLDLRLGERLGFGLSILLVNVAQDIITNAYIPISKENLWLVTFIKGSTYFIFAALFETIFVSWIYYKAGKHVEEEDMYHTLILNKNRTREAQNDGDKKESTLLKEVVEETKKEENHDDIIVENESRIDALASVSKNEINGCFETEVEELNIHPKSTNVGIISETRKKLINIFRKIPDIKPTESGDLQKTAKKLIRPLMHMTHKERLMLINAIDRVCMFLFPLSYAIFIATMFLTRSMHSDDLDNWIPFGQSTSEL